MYIQPIPASGGLAEVQSSPPPLPTATTPADIFIHSSNIILYRTFSPSHMLGRLLSSEGFGGFWQRTLALRKLKLDYGKCQDLYQVIFLGKL